MADVSRISVEQVLEMMSEDEMDVGMDVTIDNEFESEDDSDMSEALRCIKDWIPWAGDYNYD